MFIRGKDLIFYVNVSGVDVPLCHFRTCSLVTKSGLLPTTTYGSGNAETNNYSRKYSYTIKGDGLVYTADYATGFTLQGFQTTFVKVNWTFTDNQNVQWAGVCLIDQTEFDSDFDAVSTFSGDMIGDGEYTTVLTNVPPIPATGSSVIIKDQLGTPLATVQAPGIYTVTRFDTIDLQWWDLVNGVAKTPQIVITQST